MGATVRISTALELDRLVAPYGTKRRAKLSDRWTPRRSREMAQHGHELKRAIMIVLNDAAVKSVTLPPAVPRLAGCSSWRKFWGLPIPDPLPFY